MKLNDISKEYAVANKIILSAIIILLVFPFVIILTERLNYSPLSLNNIHCFVETQTGKPCPTCGLTRSIILLYKGHFKESFGLHPRSWTKYVRVVGRNQSPLEWEKGSCHEAPKEFCC